MGLITFFLLALIETGVIIFYNLSEKSSQLESFILGYSKERVFLIVFLSAALLMFLFLLITEIRNSGGKETFLKKILNDEKSLWLLIYLSLFAWVVILFLSIQEKAWFGDFYTIFSRLQAILIWTALISVQTFLFTLFWYCFNFTGIFSNQNKPYLSKDISILIGVFLFFFLVKYFFIIPAGYGLMKDVGESKYLYMVQYLSEGIFLHSANQFTTHYPFFYPLTLMFSYFIKDNSFEVIKILNSLYATSIIFPIFLVSRQILDRKTSFALVLISSFIPFQFLLPTRLLSENLYFPLFLWTIYFVFASPNNKDFRFLWDCLTGISIGVLYLTRYITFALIPFFIFLWWLKPFYGVRKIFQFERRKVLHLAAIFLVIILTYSPWVYICLSNHLSLQQALGFGIAKSTNLQQLTLENLLKWALFYLAYFALLASPILNFLIILLNQKIDDEKIRRWLIVVFTLSFAFLLAVVRHSWRADYNIGVPVRIMGRYVIYLLPLFLITSFLTIKYFDKNRYNSFLHFSLLSFVLPVLLIGFGYFLLIKGVILPIGSDFVHPLISIDASYISILGPVFFILLPSLFLITNLLLWKESGGFLWIITSALIFFYIIGEPKYLGFHKEYQHYQEIGARISSLIVKCNRNSGQSNFYDIFLPGSISRDDKDNILWSLQIRNLSSEYSISMYSPAELGSIIKKGRGIIFYSVANSSGNFPESEFVNIKKGDYVIELLNGEALCQQSSGSLTK